MEEDGSWFLNPVNPVNVVFKVVLTITEFVKIAENSICITLIR